MSPGAILLALVALALGAVIGWLLARSRAAAEVQTLAAERTKALTERDVALAERQRSEAAREEVQRRIEVAQQEKAIAQTRADEAQRVLDNHEKLRVEIENSFAALAQKAFREVGDSLVQSSRQEVGGALETKKVEIEGLLTPLRTMLEQYRSELTKSENARNESYGGLREQILALLTAQENTQREAARLANALKSPTVQGSWGELSLKRCIELAGMSSYCRDFETQQTFTSDDGKRLRPDMIVNLPNDRVIAIDAKAPLGEYLIACNETDEASRRAHLEQHAKNIRRHVDALARKEYQSLVGETLDFTVMFIPGEHFLSAALVTDPSLFEYAAEKRIILGSQTVLLPLLRAVATGWKAEKTEENAKRMHEAAVDLFNRFITVMDHIHAVGDQLRKSVDSYNKAIRSIDTRLWPKGEELQQMSGSGKNLGELKPLETLPIESSKYRAVLPAEDALLLP